eukprot:359707-Chlamydomonas_euryale.AAC.5
MVLIGDAQSPKQIPSVVYLDGIFVHLLAHCTLLFTRPCLQVRGHSSNLELTTLHDITADMCAPLQVHLLGKRSPYLWPAREDFLIAARQLNGTDFNGDGVGDYAVCWQLLDCLDGYHATGQVMASMTQSQGLETGWLFDPSNLKNFVGSPAMAKTLEILREVEQHAWKGSCEVLNPHMMSGMCAMTVKWDELFKGIQRFGFGLKDKVAVAPLPGSSTVLDRQANMLVPCTEYLCPHAKLEKTYQGDEWVNRAPYFGIGGIASMLNVKQDPVIQKAAFDFIAHVSSPKRSMELVSLQLVINEFLIGPFRDSHFDTSEDALMLWAAAGYNATAVKSFLQIGLGMIGKSFLPSTSGMRHLRYTRSILSEHFADADA